MLKCEFFPFRDVADWSGGGREALRQALLQGRLRAYVELTHTQATVLFPSEGDAPRGNSGFASWRKLHRFSNDDLEKYQLDGWFLIDRDHIREIASGEPHLRYVSDTVTLEHGRYLLDVVPALDDGAEAQTGFDPWADLAFSAELIIPPNPEKLWFRAADLPEICGFETDAKLAIEGTAATGEAPDGALFGQRERASLLAIIRALSVMAKLPERGATAAIELQLLELGFSSPKEKTIRDFLKEARELEP